MTPQRELLFENDLGKTYQDNLARCIWLQTDHRQIPLDASSFLILRRKFQQIDVEAMLNPVHSGDELEIVHLSTWDFCLVLNVRDLLAYRALFDGTMSMLELKSITHRFLPQPSLV